jgi:SAM-dependent methyltransferase
VIGMPAPPRYEAYDQFAWFYSQGWGDDYHYQFRPVLEHHIAPRLPVGAHILDLCCGTGDLSRALAAHGFRVTGIDGSEEMLEFARLRVPQAEFIREDARSFSTTTSFDAVLSTFDSLNHILSLRELKTVFLNVRAALAPGGLFVFDLNMLDSFETLWRGSTATVEEEAAVITRGSYDPKTRLGKADVTLFRLEDGAWHRYDVAVLERCYTEQEIEDTLAAAGFERIEHRDACEVGMRTDIAVGRTFFFAVRPR